MDSKNRNSKLLRGLSAKYQQMTTMNRNYSEKLKTIFDLTFGKLQEISIDDNFMREITERRNRVFNKNKPNSYFYEILVRDIFGAGLKATALTRWWPCLRDAFSHFDIKMVSEKKLEDLISNPNIIRNKAKIEACLWNAKRMREISGRFGSFGEYLSQSEGNENQLIGKMKQFKFVKDALARDYLKDIGILDTIKPDSNVLRAFFRLGFIKEGSFNEAIKVVEAFKQATSERLIVIDAVFWMYGGGGDGHVKKAMCNKKNPFCSECPLTTYCGYYKSAHHFGFED